MLLTLRRRITLEKREVAKASVGRGGPLFFPNGNVKGLNFWLVTFGF